MRRLLTMLMTLTVPALMTMLAGCYSPAQPACGFTCVQGLCPQGYHCAADLYCHKDGTDAAIDCGPSPATDARADVD